MAKVEGCVAITGNLQGRNAGGAKEEEKTSTNVVWWALLM